MKITIKTFLILIVLFIIIVVFFARTCIRNKENISVLELEKTITKDECSPFTNMDNCPVSGVLEIPLDKIPKEEVMIEEKFVDPYSVFEDFSVSIGDTLGEMVVVELTPFYVTEYSDDIAIREIKPNDIKVRLQNPILVTGEYEHISDAIGFDGYCMSQFDDTTLARLPYVSVYYPMVEVYGEPSGRFCFRNQEFAVSELGEVKKIVTVVIDNYELNSYPTETVDWVDLIRVAK